MKRLIRFEDKYGIADFFVGDKESEEIINRNIVQIDTETFISRGHTSPAIFNIRNNEVKSAVLLGIKRILIVFDLDNVAENNKILEYNNVRKSVESSLELCQKYNIQCYFIPVCYMAESVALINYCKDYAQSRAESYVHYENYKSFILHLLVCLEDKSSRDIKKFSEYLDKEKVVTRLSYISHNNNPNRYIISLLTKSEGDIGINNTYDLQEYITDVSKVFDSSVKNSLGLEMKVNTESIALSKPIADIVKFLVLNRGKGSICFVPKSKD